MTRDELAAKLHGMEYPLGRAPGARQLFAEAEAAGLVIVFGESDDLVEIEGAFSDEQDAYDGHILLIDRQGLLPYRDEVDNDEELKGFFSRQPIAVKIEAIWGRSDPGLSWSYETSLPHATFDVMEDGEPFCRGIVVAVADLPSADEAMVDAVLLGLYYDGCRATREEGWDEARWVAKCRRDYPEHVDDARAVVRRLHAIGKPPAHRHTDPPGPAD